MDIRKRSRLLGLAKEKPYRVKFDREEVPVIVSLAKKRHFYPLGIYEDIMYWNSRRKKAQSIRIGNLAILANDLKKFHDDTPSELSSMLENAESPKSAAGQLSCRHALGERALDMFFQINEYTAAKESSNLDSQLDLLLAQYSSDSETR